MLMVSGLLSLVSDFEGVAMDAQRVRMLLMGCAVLGGAGVLPAQLPLEGVPFANPEKMFERMFGEDSAADQAALQKIEISRKEEQDFGKQILQAGLAAWKAERIKVVSQGEDVDYLASLVETLQPFMTNHERYPKIRVLVAKSPRVDARSCPGGTLIFFEGLLDAAGSEAALAGIVGHELSHLDRGHQLLPLKRVKLMERQFQKGFDPEQFFQSGPWMIKLMSRPFRPEDEREADRDGAQWAFQAGYDPREMAELFQKKADMAKEPAVGANPWTGFFRTHPYDRERDQAIRKQFAELRKQHPDQELFIGAENLKLRRSRKHMEEQ